MSEGNVFGQPYQERLLDDLARTQPAWAKEATRIVPPSHTFTGADAKIGGEEKTANEGERIPMCGTKAEADYTDQMREYEALLDRRRDLISWGVDPMKLIVPLKPKRPAQTTGLPLIPHGNLAQCTNNYNTREAERDMLISIGAEDAITVRETDAYFPTTEEEAALIARDLLAKAANPLLKITPKIAIPEGVEKVRVVASATIPVTDAEQEISFQVGEILSENDLARAAADMPLSHMEKPEYVWDGAPGGKDSNPKEAFGSRKAGLSTISKQVMYEVGLAMLEGALKYGRHNYRVAGVRASTYYDACGRHMDAWWEGQDIDPDSGAKLHHITKAIAGLTVIRDSMLAGNWTDDRPPRIGDPNWLAWYNEQAAILVDACKNPKAPFTEKEHGK